MRFRTIGVLVGLCSSFTIGAGWGQEAPPAAPRMDGPAVKLAYKFRPGAVYRYRLTANGTMNIDLSKMGLPPGAGAPGAMPVDMTMQLNLTQRVKSVAADGSATVEQ